MGQSLTLPALDGKVGLPRTYYILFVLDIDNNVQESNENNNIVAIQLVVK